MYSDPRAERNRLMEIARAMGEDYTLADMYERSALGGRPVGADPRPQQNNEQSVDWLNAAGLGALAAGLTAGGVAGYRNRGRLAGMLGRGGGRPPEPPNAPPGGPGPGTGPRAGYVQQPNVYVQQPDVVGGIARQVSNVDPRRSQGAPTAPWSTDLGSPRGNQVVNLESLAELERLRNSVPDPGRNPWTGLADERARINEMRRQPAAQGVQVSDLNAPVSATPSESGVYQANQRPIEQQSTPKGGQEINAALSRDLPDMWGDNTGLEGGSDIERLSGPATADRWGSWGEPTQSNQFLSDYVNEVGEEAGPTESVGESPSTDAAGMEQTVGSTQNARGLSLEEATLVAARNRFERNKDRLAASSNERRSREGAAASARREQLPMMIEKLADAGYGTPAVRDSSGKLISTASVSPELLSQLTFYRDTGRIHQRMSQEVWEQVLGLREISPDKPNKKFLYTNEDKKLFNQNTSEERLKRSENENDQPGYDGTNRWSENILKTVYDEAELAKGNRRIKLDNLISLSASNPTDNDGRTLFDPRDVLLVSQYVGKNQNVWRDEARTLKAALRNPGLTEDQVGIINAQLAELMSVPRAQRPFFRLDKTGTPEVQAAADRMSKAANENIFADDPNATIVKALFLEEDQQNVATKGQGYTENDKRSTNLRTFAENEQGIPSVDIRNNMFSSQVDPSDYSPVLTVLDRETGEFRTGTADELGISSLNADAGISGSGVDPFEAATITGFTGKNRFLDNNSLLSGMASGDLARRDIDNEFAQGAGDLSGTDVSNLGSIKERRDPRWLFSNMLTRVNQPTVPDPSADWSGDKIGGIYSTSDYSKYKGNAGGKDFEIPDTVQEAMDLGYLKYGRIYPPNRLFQTNINILRNSGNEPAQYKYGFAPDGTPRSEAAMRYMVQKEGMNRDEIFLKDLTLLGKEYNAERSRLDDIVSEGSIRDTDLGKIGVPNLGAEYTERTQDIMIDPKSLARAYAQDPRLVNMPPRIEAINGELIERGILETGETSGGYPYVSELSVQQPPDLVDRAITSALVRIQGKTPRNVLRARNEQVTKIKEVDKNGREKMKAVSTLVDPNRVELKLLEERDGAREKAAQDYLESIIQELIDATPEGSNGEFTLAQKQRADSLLDPMNKNSIVNIEYLLPESDDHTEDLVKAEISKGDDDPRHYYDSPEKVQRKLEQANPEERKLIEQRIQDDLRQQGEAFERSKIDWLEEDTRGLFPISPTLHSAREYNYVAPKEVVEKTTSTGDTESYAFRKGAKNPALFLAATQAAQVQAQKDMGLGKGQVYVQRAKADGSKLDKDPNAMRIRVIDDAIEAYETGSRYAGLHTPIKDAGLIAASTITQTPGPLRLKIDRPRIKIQDPDNPLEGEYSGFDAAQWGSKPTYGVDQATRLAGQIRDMRGNMDPSDPQYGQLVELESSVLRDAEASKPLGRGALNPLARVETDPAYAAKIYGPLVNQGPRTRIKVPTQNTPENIGAQEGRLKGAQLASLGQELLDQAKQRRQASSSNPATARPGRREAMRGAPAQTVMDRSRDDDPGVMISTYGGDVGLRMSGNPADNIRLTNKQVRAIQNPVKGQVAELGRQIKANQQVLKDVAYASPIGQYTLRPQTYNLGSLGASPGDQGFKPLYNDGGNIIGELVEDKDMKTSREVVFSPGWLANATSTTRGNLPDLTPRLSPDGMTASQAVSTYGLTPDQISATMTKLMGQARDDANRDARNRQALAAATREYNNQF